MNRAVLAIVLACAALGAASIALAQSNDKLVARGQYLVTFGGCNDCHTPKIMTPQGPGLDQSRLLSGQPADAPVPPVPPGVLGPNGWTAMTRGLTAWVGPWGTSFAANLTPDKETGLGGWTYDQFAKSLRTGKHFGTGRPILPPMPWLSSAALSDQDLRAVFAYLKSIKPIANKVPAPIPPAH